MAAILSLLLNVVGLGLFAVAMPRCWQQMPRRLAIRSCPKAAFRVVGAVALAASLAICLVGGKASTGAIIWGVQLAISSTIVAAILIARSIEN